MNIGRGQADDDRCAGDPIDQQVGQPGAQQPADQADRDGLHQDHPQHAPAGPADSAQHADLARAFHNRHELGVHHAYAADQDRQAADGPNKTVEHLGHALLVGEFLCAADRNIGPLTLETCQEALADLRPRQITGSFFQADVEQADLARPAEQLLGVFQREQSAAVFEGIAGLVDADHAIDRAGDAHRVADRLVHHFGGSRAEQNRRAVGVLGLA